MRASRLFRPFTSLPTRMRNDVDELFAEAYVHAWLGCVNVFTRCWSTTRLERDNAQHGTRQPTGAPHGHAHGTGHGATAGVRTSAHTLWPPVRFERPGTGHCHLYLQSFETSDMYALQSGAAPCPARVRSCGQLPRRARVRRVQTTYSAGPRLDGGTPAPDLSHPWRQAKHTGLGVGRPRPFDATGHRCRGGAFCDCTRHKFSLAGVGSL